MPTKPVLHLYDPDHKLDVTFLADAFIAQGSDLAVHIGRGGDSVEVWQYRRESGSSSVESYVLQGCNCP